MFICMRTTINLNDELVAKAQVCTGIKEKTRLIHLGLEALIQREAALRLAALVVRPRLQKQAGASGALTRLCDAGTR